MESTPLHELTDKERDRIHIAIGRFVVEFQMICFFVRFCYANILKLHHLTDLNLIRVMIDDKNMSESLLIDSLRSACLIAFSDDETRKLVKRMHKIFRQLLEERNRILHGTWLVGEGHIALARGPQASHGFKTARRDTGVEYDHLPVIEELESLVQRASETKKTFQILPFMLGDPSEIRKWQGGGEES